MKDKRRKAAAEHYPNAIEDLSTSDEYESEEQEEKENQEKASVHLAVDFIPGRKTKQPHVLWHSESRTIWVRGVYRRSDTPSTHIKIRLKLVASTDTEKLAMVMRMKIQQDGDIDTHIVEKVFGGTHAAPQTHEFVYQRTSCESGVVQLGACFFTKKEHLDKVPLRSNPPSKGLEYRKIYMGRYDLEAKGRTRYWTPDIRLVIPTTYKRYIERVGEENVVFIQDLTHGTVGGWMFKPMAMVSTPCPQDTSDEDSQEDSSQASGDSQEEEEEHETFAYPGESSPAKKSRGGKPAQGMRGKNAKKYVPATAVDVLAEFFRVQELMVIDDAPALASMVADTFEQRALGLNQRGSSKSKHRGPVEVEAETNIRSIVTQDGSSPSGDSTETLYNEIRMLWRNQKSLERELKNTQNTNKRIIGQYRKVVELFSIASKRKAAAQHPRQRIYRCKKARIEEASNTLAE